VTNTVLLPAAAEHAVTMSNYSFNLQLNFVHIAEDFSFLSFMSSFVKAAAGKAVPVTGREGP
jgi:hypothetical protein